MMDSFHIYDTSNCVPPNIKVTPASNGSVTLNVTSGELQTTDPGDVLAFVCERDQYEGNCVRISTLSFTQHSINYPLSTINYPLSTIHYPL